MTDDITTQPMLEALLDGQRQIVSQLAELAVKLEEILAKQEALAANQEALARRQDGLEARLVELTREVRDGLDDCNRKIEALNKRLLSFETWLSRIDDRLHHEIVARTR